MFRSMVTSTTERAAAEVRAELARQNITSRELAARLGKAPTSTARRVRGEQPLTVDDLEAIAKALGVPVSQFLAKSA